MIKLPEAVAAVIFALAACSTAHAETVLVGSGDTLAHIARRHLGDARRWPELCELNATLLENNCDRVLAGTILVLPGDSETPRESTALVAVAIAELPPELIALSPTDSPEIISGVISPDPGQRRVRYAFNPELGATYHVNWPLEIDSHDDSTVIVYDTQIIGRVDVSHSSGVPEITSSGVVFNAVASELENGWLMLSFSLSELTEDASVQLLLYPVGTSGTTRTAAVPFQFSPPSVAMLANQTPN